MHDWVMHPARRALAKKFLDRVASDAQFREQLLDDPQGALNSSGLAQEFREFQASTSEVSGYSMDTGISINAFFGDVLLDGLPDPKPESDPAGLGVPPSPDPGALPPKDGGPGYLGPPVSGK